MIRSVTASLAIVVALLALGAVSAGAASRPTLGIADQKATMFDDDRFVALGVRYVRINVRWDVFGDADARANLDAWMAGARRRGARVLVTFDRSPRRPSYNPTAAQMVAAMRQMRSRYRVREFSTWNEPNINKRPELVARWWLAMRRASPASTVLAGDLVDRGNAVSWARRFNRSAGRKAPIWGLHNYISMNRLQSRPTLAFIRAIGGRIWLTETGGIVSRSNRSQVAIPTGTARAVRVNRYLLTTLPRQSRKIARIYLYHWNIDPPGDRPHSWDSALIGPDGKARGSLAVIARYLGRPVPPDPEPGS